MDLLIVGNPQDKLAQVIASDFAKTNKQVVIRDLLQASQLFTLEVRHGEVHISPEIPIILRPLATDLVQKNFDQSFHQGEALSTLWAITTVTSAPVLNRPTPHNMWGLLSQSSVLTQQRATLQPDSEEVFTASFPSSLPAVEEKSQQWFIQDTTTYQITDLNTLPDGQGPYRSRRVPLKQGYEMVVVLKNQAWRSTELDLTHLELESRSIQLLQNLKLDFGVVLWGINESLTEITLAKVDAFPSFEQIGLVWPEFIVHLHKVLFS
jgi:hypothetical protein